MSYTLTRTVAFDPDLAAETYRAEGLNTAVGTDPLGVSSVGAINLLTAAATLNLSSSSTDDDAVGGTGALTVYVAGLDDDHELVTETVELDGQVAVPMTSAIRRVLELRVVTVGSGGENAGDIYLSTGALTNGVPDVAAQVYGKILAGNGEAQAALHTVRAGRVGIVTDIAGSIAHATSPGVLRLWTREEGGPARMRWSRRLLASALAECLEVPVRVGEGADIWLEAEMDANSTEVAASLCVIETYGL